jgi:hypothetical protein
MVWFGVGLANIFRRRKMRLKKFIAIPVLFLVLVAAACKIPAWVDTAEGLAKIAVPVATAIVSAVDPALAPVAVGVEAAFKALIATFDAYKKEPNDTALQSVQAALGAVNANITALEDAAHIKDPNSAQKVTQIVDLLNQAVIEIGALIPPPTAAQMQLPRKAGVATGLSPDGLKQEFNTIVQGDPVLGRYVIQ